MHMADALLSPQVGGAMWAATGAATLYSARKVRRETDDRKVPLMGVLGAFIFAAQMLNFTIPAVGSSGHLGGGTILAALLGPHAAFIVMASVLAVQALFFADGGLLALGCNIFNLGFFPCFVAYPLIYKKVAGDSPTQGRIMAGSLLAAVVGLQLGSLGVVLQTYLSGVSELPLPAFLALMQPIHLAIGVVEGVSTALVVSFIWREEPDIIIRAAKSQPLGAGSMKKVLVSLGVLALLFGGVFSWFASTRPDGLEWAIARVSGKEELSGREGGVHSALSDLQEKTAVMPDYGFKDEESKAGTSAAGLVGGVITLGAAALFGWLLKRRRTSPQ